MANKRLLPDRLKESLTRPTDVGRTLARSILVRTLRHAGLHHVLRGHPCILAFVVDDDDDRQVFADAAKALLRDLSRADLGMLDTDNEVVVFDRGKFKRITDRTYLRDTIASHLRYVAFAPSVDDLPGLVRMAADAVLTPAAGGRRAVRGAIRKVLGRSPADALLDACEGVSLSMLGFAIRPHRSLHQTVRLLRSMQVDGPSDPGAAVDEMRGPTLDDIHGLGEAAERGRSLAQDLADYQAGRIPWSDVDPGMLVSGPTGTGKTTFARALANTCRLPLHAHSLAGWQAKGHMGDLLKAMRAAFEAAKKDAPCILFLDELDSFGDRERLSGTNANYEREVINGFLECLDGIGRREGVVVVGATNHPDRIDAAIRRPGRLDRHVVIPLPDLDARKGILRHHLREALPGADLTEAADRLEGASGAVIEQVVRDARRRARTGRREMAAEDLLASLPKRVKLTDASFRRACVHEAGHAVVGFLLADESGRLPVEVKVYREVSPESAAGHTAYRRLVGAMRTRSGYLAEITGMLAGLAAEEVVFGARSDGSGGSDGSDLQQATILAAGMEVSFGLGQGLAYLSPSDDAKLLERLSGDPALAGTVNRTLGECLARAGAVLREKRPALDGVVGLLGRNGCATIEDIHAIMTEATTLPG